MTRLVAVALFLVGLITDRALAHPGHGITDAASAPHYLLEIPHIIPILAVVAIALSAWVLHHRIGRP